MFEQTQKKKYKKRVCVCVSGSGLCVCGKKCGLGYSLNSHKCGNEYAPVFIIEFSGHTDGLIMVYH